MNARVLTFVAGGLAGAYASVKARRAAYRLSVPGLADQAGALATGLQAFAAEVREGMDAREAQIARDLDIPLELLPGRHAPPPAIEKDTH